MPLGGRFRKHWTLVTAAVADGVTTALGGAGALLALTVADQACHCPRCGADLTDASPESPLGRKRTNPCIGPPDTGVGQGWTSLLGLCWTAHLPVLWPEIVGFTFFFLMPLGSSRLQASPQSSLAYMGGKKEIQELNLTSFLQS